MRYSAPLNKLLFVLMAGTASTAAYANWETAVAAFIADEVAADVVQEAPAQEPAAEEVPAPLMPPPPPFVIQRL